MVNKIYRSDSELLEAIKLARVNRLYSPEQGLLTNYIDFESIIKEDANALMSRGDLELTIVLSSYENEVRSPYGAQEKTPVGVMVVFKMNGGVNNLWSFVKKEHRGHGIATEMFECIQICNKESGVEIDYSYGSPYLKELLER